MNLQISFLSFIIEEDPAFRMPQLGQHTTDVEVMIAGQQFKRIKDLDGSHLIST